MGYFSSYLTNTNQKLLIKEAGTFTDGYAFWFENLFERSIKLFEWKNTEGIEPHEIEVCLMGNGSGCVTDKYNNTLSIFNGYQCGEPTQYFDRFKSFSVFSPVFSGIFEIGKECEIIRNNAIMNSVYPLVHRYAIMLSHTETSFVNTLINGRDSGGVPVASTQNAKTALETYRNNLCNGRVMPILDPAFSAVEFKGVDKNSPLNIKDLIEVRENLVNSFYNDIGVKTAYNKKGNMINEEVEADNSKLLLNLSEMLYQRQRGAERVNKMYGTNWSVDISPEIKLYNKEESEGITNGGNN